MVSFNLFFLSYWAHHCICDWCLYDIVYLIYVLRDSSIAKSPTSLSSMPVYYSIFVKVFSKLFLGRFSTPKIFVDSLPPPSISTILYNHHNLSMYQLNPPYWMSLVWCFVCSRIWSINWWFEIFVLFLFTSSACCGGSWTIDVIR